MTVPLFLVVLLAIGRGFAGIDGLLVLLGYAICGTESGKASTRRPTSL